MVMCCTSQHLRVVIPCVIFILIGKFFLWKFLLRVYFPEWGPLLNFYGDDFDEEIIRRTHLEEEFRTTLKVLDGDVEATTKFDGNSISWTTTRKRPTVEERPSLTPKWTTTTITSTTTTKDPWSNRFWPHHKVYPPYETSKSAPKSTTPRVTSTTSPTTTSTSTTTTTSTTTSTTTTASATTTSTTPRPTTTSTRPSLPPAPPTTTILSRIHVAQTTRHPHQQHHHHHHHWQHIDVPAVYHYTPSIPRAPPRLQTTTQRPWSPYQYPNHRPTQSPHLPQWPHFNAYWTRYPTYPTRHPTRHHHRHHQYYTVQSTTTSTTEIPTEGLRSWTESSVTPSWRAWTTKLKTTTVGDEDFNFWIPMTSKPLETTTTDDGDLFWMKPVPGRRPLSPDYTITPSTRRPYYAPTTTPLPDPFTISVFQANFDNEDPQKNVIPEHPVHPQHHHHHHGHKHHKRREAPVIVTALMDIGRGEWPQFTRPFDLYLSYLLDLLAIENHIIIYCDRTVSEFIFAQTGIDLDRIQVVVIFLQDLPFYRYKEEMQTIIDWEQKNWDPEWDRKMKGHPESLYVDYDILVNSKAYLMENATVISRFPGEFFVWVDAGYSHGSQDKIPRELWTPNLPHEKISVVKITPDYDKATKYTIDKVYRKNWVVISGGFLAGDRPTISRFYRFYYKTFMDLLDARKVDDDQTTLVMMCVHYSSLFNILHGDWFDAFKLLPSQ